MQNVDLVYFNAGGGHRAAARALQAAIQLQGRPWSVRLVNLFEVLDPARRFNHWFGFNPETYYNTRIALDFTFGLSLELPILQAMIRRAHRPLRNRMQRYWARTRPDIVVSVVPNFNRPLIDGLGAARPGVPYMTVMTDMADLPPHFWMEPDLDQRLVCGTPRAVQQARDAGMDMRRVALASGMILRPDFYAQEPVDRAAARGQSGFSGDEPVGLVTFGGLGSMKMLDIARTLQDRPLILLCGHNERLRKRLEAERPHARHVAVGFTSQVHRYLQQADYVIGKPGPASISEAIVLGLPVITFENRSTLPQERYNVQWLRDMGVGLAVAGNEQLPAAVAAVCQSLPDMRARAQAIDIHAVFEIPDMIEEWMARPDSTRFSVGA